MSSDPALALQKAFVAAIKALQTEAGGNVFDRVPASAKDAFPRVTVGEAQIVGNYAECYDGSEAFIIVDVWSRKPGMPQAQQIASAIRTGLHDADLDLEGHTLELLDFESVNYLKDPDGLTRRARMQFRALTQPKD